MDEKFKQLSRLGAGEFSHLNGSLIDHLVGTCSLLKQWGAPEVLQDAGLFHAAYGTAGISERLVATEQRHDIANIIGKEAEEIVYLYCACDREYLWPQFKQTESLIYKNRFNSQLMLLGEQEARDLCELTVANELEIARNNTEFITEHGQSLYRLFTNMKPYLSENAISEVEQTLLK